MWYRALVLSRLLTFAEAPIPLLAGIDRGSQQTDTQPRHGVSLATVQGLSPWAALAAISLLSTLIGPKKLSVVLHPEIFMRVCGSIFFTSNRGRALLLWGGVRNFTSIMICVFWWRTRSRARLDSGDKFDTQQRICTLKKFREMLVIKFKSHGINSLEGTFYLLSI